MSQKDKLLEETLGTAAWNRLVSMYMEHYGLDRTSAGWVTLLMGMTIAMERSQAAADGREYDPAVEPPWSEN